MTVPSVAMVRKRAAWPVVAVGGTVRRWRTLGRAYGLFMAMRVDADFARPLSQMDRRRLVLAMACLSKSRRVFFCQGDHHLVVVGEALSARVVEAAIRAEGFAPTSVTSSLAPDEDARCDEAGTGEGERVRAIGR